jgi:hypothetical protein
MQKKNNCYNRSLIFKGNLLIVTKKKRNHSNFKTCVKYQKQGIWLRPPKLRIDFFLDRDDSEDEIVGTEEALIVEESNTPALATNQSHLSKTCFVLLLSKEHNSYFQKKKKKKRRTKILYRCRRHFWTLTHESYQYLRTLHVRLEHLIHLILIHIFDQDPIYKNIKIGASKMILFNF